jgi:hypothetical protein
MPDVDGWRIDTMTDADLELAVEWARREGWNPGLRDAACFGAADVGGFLIGTLGGRPVATISAVRYGDDFAFVGLYIVDPAFRGRGWGLRIWTAAIERLDGRVVGLDGVVDQQDNYRQSGFELAHRNVRFAGQVAGTRHPDVVALSPADLADVAVIDESCFGALRPGFLRAWLGQAGSLAVGVRDSSGLMGFGVIRPAADGFKVGPLFADDSEIAAALLDSLAEHAGPGATVVLDVPEPNAAGVALAGARGMTPVFETARMYRGGDRDLPLERIFGITSFELG